MQGGYSAYADPIARRAIAVSTEQQHDNASHPNHPTHISRLQNNIRRRIRDPSQRHEIVAHYNPDSRESLIQQRGWEYIVHNSLATAPPILEGSHPSHSQYHSPRFVGTDPSLHYTAQSCRNVFSQPPEQNLHSNRSYENHFNNALYIGTEQANNNLRQRNIGNEPFKTGIPQFQGNKNISPHTTSSINAFYVPSDFQSKLPYVNHYSPTRSQILPFDNFISPSEQQNLDSHVGSFHDDLPFDINLFHDKDISCKQSHTLPFEELSQHYPYSSSHGKHPFGGSRNVSGGDIDQSHVPHSVAPSYYQGTRNSSLSDERFNRFPAPNYQPIEVDHYGAPTVQYSERDYATELSNAGPPFRNHPKFRKDTKPSAVANTNDDFQRYREHTETTTKQKSECTVNTALNLELPVNEDVAKGTSFHGFGKSSASRSVKSSSTSSDHMEYPIVRRPKPFVGPNQIRFFNEGIEVDIKNQPLPRPHSSVTAKVNVDTALQQNDFDSNDDFDLLGKTTLWGAT